MSKDMVDEAGSNVNGADSKPTTTLAALATQLLDERKARQDFLSNNIFGEPGWHILLALIQEPDCKLPVTALPVADGVPAPTGLRWLQFLQSEGLTEIRDDPDQGCGTCVFLSPHGLASMTAYLRELAATRGLDLVI